MDFVVNHERCCPSELRPGEAKRVPRDRARALAGYYIACPRCGRPQILSAKSIDPDRGLDVVEAGSLVTITPAHRCTRCGARYRIERSKFVEET